MTEKKQKGSKPSDLVKQVNLCELCQHERVYIATMEGLRLCRACYMEEAETPEDAVCRGGCDD